MNKQLKRPKILVVDDDRLILEISTEYLKEVNADIKTANNGITALTIAEEFLPDIIISDNIMPEMKGIELCRKIRKNDIFNTSLFILTSSITVTSNDIIEALNNGADDFIKKDLKKDEYIAKIRAYIRIQSLQENLKKSNDDLKKEREELQYSYKQITIMAQKLEKNNKELELINENRKNDLKNSLELISKLIEIRRQYHRGHAKEVSKISCFIAKRLDLSDDLISSIKTASLLHEIGKIGIPSELANKQPNEYSKEEKILLSQHPVEGASILKEYLGENSDIVKIIRHTHEKYDGTGQPDGLKGDEIPIGSRIIAVANIFDNVLNRTKNGNLIDTLEIINNLTTYNYDPHITLLLQEYISKNEIQGSIKVKDYRLYELKPGMILATDIFTRSGTKLLHKDTELTEHEISIIIQYNKTDPIENNIYIKG